MSKSWSGGSTRRWRKVRAAVLAENQRTNQGRCTLAVPGVCTGQATVAHHTKGRAVTGDDPKFIVGACAECNGHVGEPGRHSPQPKRVSRW